MEFKSWDQLREPDQRALHFTPWGLGPQMRPEDNADYVQKVLATFALAPQVAEGTLRSFDRLRGILPYGITNYEIFTAVADLALLTIEQALRDRFLEHHQGTAVFVDPAGADRAFPVSSYDDVYRLAQKRRGRRTPRRSPQPRRSTCRFPRCGNYGSQAAQRASTGCSPRCADGLAN